MPSFFGLTPASGRSSKAKRHNVSTNTTHELLLRSELWRMGLRYRKNVRSLPGKPDIVFRRPKVAVFCDGDFWHGRHWSDLETKLSKGWNGEYWVAKIAGNRERDELNTAELERKGWHVIRIWESDIRRDPADAARKVFDAIKLRKAAFKAQGGASGERHEIR